MNFSDEEIKRQMRLGADNRWAFKEIEFVGKERQNDSEGISGVSRKIS